MMNYNYNHVVTDKKLIKEALECFLQCENGFFIDNMEYIAEEIVKIHIHEFGDYVFDLESYINQIVTENRFKDFEFTTIFKKACKEYLLRILEENFSVLLFRYSERVINIEYTDYSCMNSKIKAIVNNMTPDHSFDEFKRQLNAVT